MRTSTHLAIRHVHHVAVLSFATSRLRPGILRARRLVSVRRAVPRFLFCPTLLSGVESGGFAGGRASLDPDLRSHTVGLLPQTLLRKLLYSDFSWQ